MLRRLRLSVAIAVIAAGFTVPAVAFNPAGRSKKAKPAAPQKSKPAAAAPSSGSKAPAAKPAGEAPAAKPAAGGEGQSREALIARYTGIVLAQPGAEFPLDRLTQLYRERDGNLDKLLAELAERVAKDPTPYSALVALGGVYKKDAQPERAGIAAGKCFAHLPNVGQRLPDLLAPGDDDAPGVKQPEAGQRGFLRGVENA